MDVTTAHWTRLHLAATLLAGLGLAALILNRSGQAQAGAAPVAQVGGSQEAATQPPNHPGQFDYYLLDMPWGPLFCSTIKDVSVNCKPQSGFVVHGLWPQNRDGSWPQFCSESAAPANLANYLDLTPDLTLLQHEWAKHGTCSALPGEGYFGAARVAFQQVRLPLELMRLNTASTYTPAMALNLFYVLNPDFPAGSFSLTCKEGHVTSVQACFDKGLRPIACQGLSSCQAQMIAFDPPVSLVP